MNESNISVNFSGTLDTRNASYTDREGNMTFFPNVDRLYGPYDSKEEAWQKLSATNKYGNNALVVGKTVAIKVDGKEVEYWFEKACQTIDDLVEKGGTKVEINLLPEGDDYTKVEGIRLYNAVKKAPMNAKFTGLVGDKEFTLQTYITSAGVIITYIDGDTEQRLDIDKDTYKVTPSYVEFA